MRKKGEVRNKDRRRRKRTCLQSSQDKLVQERVGTLVETGNPLPERYGQRNRDQKINDGVRPERRRQRRAVQRAASGSV
jgi:hypothetical protein